MKSFGKLFLLIFFIFLQESTQKAIPDNIIIPKTTKSRLLPSSPEQNEEEEPNLKI